MPKVEVIVALDVADAASALRLVDGIPDLSWAKVGPALAIDGGPSLVRELKQRDVRVFLDLKWHDIPNTVAGAVERAALLGVDLVTVHALGGERMLAAAVEAAGPMRVAGVSVLTSHTAEDYWGARGASGTVGNLTDEVTRLSRLAVDAGVHAVVTSPTEAAAVRAAVGAAPWIVVPGIRLAGSLPDDQRRVAGPSEAAAAGATHLVVGRPIIRAENPRAVYQSIREDASRMGSKRG